MNPKYNISDLVYFKAQNCLMVKGRIAWINFYISDNIVDHYTYKIEGWSGEFQETQLHKTLKAVLK